MYTKNISRFKEEKRKRDLIEQVIKEQKVTNSRTLSERPSESKTGTYSTVIGIGADPSSQSTMTRKLINRKSSKLAETQVESMKSFQKVQHLPQKQAFHSKPVPQEIRKNPFAVLPPLTMKELNKGLYTLVNQGYLPKFIDITPALQRNDPLIVTKAMSPTNVIYNDSMLDLNILETDPNLRRTTSELTSGTTSNPRATTPLNMLSQNPSVLVTSPLNSPLYATDQTAANSDHDAVPKKDQKSIVVPVPKKAEDFVKFMKERYIEVVSGTVKKDQEFLRFKANNLNEWGDIEEVINQVISYAASKRLLSYRIRIEEVKRLSILMRDITKDEIINCIENYKKILNFIESCRAQTKQLDNEEFVLKIVIRLQRYYRRKLAVQLKKKLLNVDKKIRIIQFRVKLDTVYKNTLKRRNEINADRYKTYLTIQKQLSDNWESISNSKRVEIHLNSLSRICN